MASGTIMPCDRALLKSFDLVSSRRSFLKVTSTRVRVFRTSASIMASFVRFSHCSASRPVEDAVAVFGGGVFAITKASFEATNVSFEDCEAAHAGGALTVCHQ